ncbi:dihydropteroate synthase [Striga asiatica]|uniref:Dihydropteroate synthase n=1 Tax=Striga asiatica TaxID=4170 RepID=A0A5A7QR59_STRAF|nr:dihydropteroate synthase [Striga asiatica]
MTLIGGRRAATLKTEGEESTEASDHVEIKLFLSIKLRIWWIKLYFGLVDFLGPSILQAAANGWRENSPAVVSDLLVSSLSRLCAFWWSRKACEGRTCPDADAVAVENHHGSIPGKYDLKISKSNLILFSNIDLLEYDSANVQHTLCYLLLRRNRALNLVIFHKSAVSSHYTNLSYFMSVLKDIKQHLFKSPSSRAQFNLWS